MVMLLLWQQRLNPTLLPDITTRPSNTASDCAGTLSVRDTIAYPLAKRRGDWRAGLRPSQPSSLLSFWGYPSPLQGFIQKNVPAHVNFLFTTWSASVTVRIFGVITKFTEICIAGNPLNFILSNIWMETLSRLKQPWPLTQQVNLGSYIAPI